MDWWLLTFFLGAILSLFLPIVPVLSQLFLLLLLAIVFFYHKRLRTSSGLLFGACWLLFNAYHYQHQIPTDLVNVIKDKQALIIEGQVLTLTTLSKEIKASEQQKKYDKKVKFNFKVIKVNDHILTQDFIIRVNWNKATVDIGQGQSLKLKVKLKPAHGLANLGSFNYQAWLKSKGIVATGYVVNDRKHSHHNLLLSDSISLRQQLFNQYQDLFMQNKESEHPLRALMYALAFGERSQLMPEHWRVLRATGTGHLIAISGLHLGLVATGGYFIMMMLVRLLPLGLLSSQKFPLNKLSSSTLASSTLPLKKIIRLNHFVLNNALLNSNSRYIAIFFSIAITVFYGFLAGFSLPTQRALVMLITYWLARLLAIKLSVKRWFLLTIMILTLMSPFSLFTASFWLSVYAVSFIFLTLWRFRFYLKQGNAAIRFLKGLLMIQVSLTIMLLPISALFFQQLSVVAFFANIVAVPWMSFISIPCALLSVVLMPVNEFLAQFFILISVESIELLWHYLTFIADFTFAQQGISQWQQQLLTLVIAFVFIRVFLAPSMPMSLIFRGLLSKTKNRNKSKVQFENQPRLVIKNKAQRTKYWASIITLSIISAISALALSGSEYTKANETKITAQQANVWQLHLFDVGHGLSILISRDGQALLYDTGSAYPSGFNMAESVIIPYLQYAGIKHLDKIFLSHSDNDHAGGLTQLLAGINVRQLITNDSKLAKKHQQIVSCYQGMKFNWQNLSVKALWPLMPEKKAKLDIDQLSKTAKATEIAKNDRAKTKETKQGNDDSCVLLISDGKHKVLLTGDISKKVERKLISIYPELTADVLLVPHHGSKTSSSQEFIQQLSPKIALVSSGFLNRWKMPVKQVTSRYQQQGVTLLKSSDKGQIVLTFANDITIENYHDDLRPFWFSQ